MSQILAHKFPPSDKHKNARSSPYGKKPDSNIRPWLQFTYSAALFPMLRKNRTDEAKYEQHLCPTHHRRVAFAIPSCPLQTALFKQNFALQAAYRRIIIGQNGTSDFINPNLVVIFTCKIFCPSYR
jgi:hypothetical protein